jgi:hypothetical protein
MQDPNENPNENPNGTSWITLHEPSCHAAPAIGPGTDYVAAGLLSPDIA